MHVNMDESEELRTGDEEDARDEEDYVDHALAKPRWRIELKLISLAAALTMARGATATSQADSSQGKKRIFVCVELSDSDVDAVARTIELLQCQHPWKQLRNHTRWVNPRSSHLTLRFLGDMGDEEIETLRSKLDLELAALGNLEPFPLAAASLGTFQRKACRLCCGWG
ncbi:hypothetical protein GUITHDRAFT_135610 [Guillardia theta CCMP2712]|uniref:Phosphoesterase HXTX domain-containing protein n=1 Tax=Guillardia theta (strain CCMP2712) TaxID=905079 RepID=L1JNA6_GUITC|nr:hypothetical protein GUITHDRAFT_135610 [Guillardia theta CCMP2712]EKX49922.1 hypothetical protein GUITHDRAFT_135610 [Guillardia theta CCMP2712]|eukprot:XP_005836902.1 hypothetical protein GUITHDRAFT_135610 [Guillardia theta CCMP2712]